MDNNKIIDTAATVIVAGMALGVAKKMIPKSKPMKPIKYKSSKKVKW
jgi:hypothetical protein